MLGSNGGEISDNGEGKKKECVMIKVWICHFIGTSD